MTLLTHWRTTMTLLALFVLGGCASNVVTDHETGANFAQYQTWAFAPEEGNGILSLDGSRIRQAVERELAGTDLERTDEDRADLLVNYRVEEVERLDTSGLSLGLGFGHRPFGFGFSTVPPVREIREGKLVLELVDSDRDQVIWRAASKRHLNEDQSSQKREALIDEVVTEMLSRYPPGQ